MGRFIGEICDSMLDIHKHVNGESTAEKLHSLMQVANW